MHRKRELVPSQQPRSSELSGTTDEWQDLSYCGWDDVVGDLTLQQDLRIPDFWHG